MYFISKQDDIKWQYVRISCLPFLKLYWKKSYIFFSDCVSPSIKQMHLDK